MGDVTAATCIGRGVSGCVVDVAPELIADTVHVLLEPPPPFSATAVYKIAPWWRPEGQSLLTIARLLQRVDAAHAFTVPYERIGRATVKYQRQLMASGEFDLLLEDAVGARITVLRVIQMRRGESFGAWARASTSVGAVLRALAQLMRDTLALHECGIGHGDIKEQNVLFFPADGRLRLIDFDCMFPYDMSTLDACQPDWRAVVASKTDEQLRAAFENAEETMLAQSWARGVHCFPPDNVFLNQSALLMQFTPNRPDLGLAGMGANVSSIYSALPAEYFTRRWRDGLDAWRQHVQAIQTAAAGATADSRRVDTLDFRAHFDTLYHPHKHMVFQFAILLKDISCPHHARLKELRCARAVRAVVSHGSMALGADRPELPAFVAQVEALAQKVYDAEAAVRRVQPKRACRA